MHRREFLGAAAAAPLAAAGRKPNIVFVLADQWRPQALPSAGDVDIDAPNLGRLAREGVHFNRCYVTNPVCSPSRATLQTGRWPHACGMPRNDRLMRLEEDCIAARLKEAGYRTGYIGKWHLDGEDKPGFVPPGPRRRGYDYWAAFNRGHAYYNSTYYLDSPEPVRRGGFEPDYQTDLAIDFVRANKANPFYLFLSWGPPHTPRTPPEHARKYDPRMFHLAPNVPWEYGAEARKGMTGYYGLCSALDANLGRLLGAIDKEGIANDTLVVFTSDHGDMLGAHGLEYKGVPYEESARVPLLMRLPGRLKANSTQDLLVSNADLMPTLLSLAGATIPSAVHGRDLSRKILDGKGDEPDSVYVYGKLGTPEEWRMIVRGMDKMVINAKGEITHLFNLAQDQFEQFNRASEPAHKRMRDELRAHIHLWMRRVGDKLDPSGLRLRP